MHSKAMALLLLSLLYLSNLTVQLVDAIITFNGIHFNKVFSRVTTSRPPLFVYSEVYSGGLLQSRIPDGNLDGDDDGNDVSSSSSRLISAGKQVTYIASSASRKRDALATQLWPSSRLLAADVYQLVTDYYNEYGGDVRSGWNLTPPDSVQKGEVQQKDRRSQLLKEHEGLTVLELGAGLGLVSMAAAFAGADNVICTDYDPFALQLVQKAAHEQGLCNRFVTEVYDLTCSDVSILPKADLYVMTDVFVDQAVARGAARHAFEGICRGSCVIVADARRACRTEFMAELKDLTAGSVWAKEVEFRASSYGHCNKRRIGNGPSLWLVDVDEENLNYALFS